eukprot:1323701-Rhodomonas_salina.1
MLGFLVRLWMDRRRERRAIFLSDGSMPMLISKMMCAKQFRRELMGLLMIMEMNDALRKLPYQGSLSH